MLPGQRKTIWKPKGQKRTKKAKRDKWWHGHLATDDPSFLKFGENLEAKALKKMRAKTKRAATDKGWDGLLNYQRSIFWRFGENAEKEQHAWISTI